MDVTDLYRSQILDHNRSPRNFREIADASHEARGLNALCGDDIRVFLRVEDGIVADVSFIGQAGAITMASASMMTEAIKGRPVSEALSMKESLGCLLKAPEVTAELREEVGDLAALEGVRRYPSRISAALLGWETMVAALEGRDLASTE